MKDNNSDTKNVKETTSKIGEILSHHKELEHQENYIAFKNKVLDFEAYDNVIKELADNESSFVFTNSNPRHATIIIANIFRTAKDHIRIFARNLCGEVSNGEYLIQLESFVKRGKKLTVKLEEKEESNNSEAIKLILNLQKSFPSKISIGVVKDDALKQIKHNSNIYHFTIGDERMYRFETDTENYIAVANFNDEHTCKELIKKFEEIPTEAIN